MSYSTPITTSNAWAPYQPTVGNKRSISILLKEEVAAYALTKVSSLDTVAFPSMDELALAVPALKRLAAKSRTPLPFQEVGKNNGKVLYATIYRRHHRKDARSMVRTNREGRASLTLKVSHELICKGARPFYDPVMQLLLKDHKCPVYVGESAPNRIKFSFGVEVTRHLSQWPHLWGPATLRIWTGNPQRSFEAYETPVILTKQSRTKRSSTQDRLPRPPSRRKTSPEEKLVPIHLQCKTGEGSAPLSARICAIHRQTCQKVDINGEERVCLYPGRYQIHHAANPPPFSFVTSLARIRFADNQTRVLHTSDASQGHLQVTVGSAVGSYLWTHPEGHGPCQLQIEDLISHNLYEMQISLGIRPKKPKASL